MRRSKFLRRLLKVFLPATLVSAFLLSSGAVPQASAAAYIDTAISVNGTTQPGLNYGIATSALTSTDQTIELWAKHEGAYSAGVRYALWQSNDKYLFIKDETFWWHHENATDTDTGVIAPNNEWFNVAIVVTYSTKTVKLVLNGTSTAWSKTFTTYSVGGYTQMMLGCSYTSTSSVAAVNFWVGKLDQLKFWGSALTDTQISQSMHTYSSVGVSGSPTLSALYDMNAQNTASLTTAVGTGPSLSPTSGSLAYSDVKTVDTVSRSGKTVFIFPRTYLTAQGGWQPTASYGATYEYLAVAGGGGGGGNRGGGGGAGGLVSGSVSLPFNGSIQIVVGVGGYSSANGSDSKIVNSKATTPLVSATGGGAGGTTTGTNVNGQNGGSGGGASMCYVAGPSTVGGTGIAGQGFDGASNDSTNCATSTPENRHTGGGGGSGGPGQQGSGGSTAPTASTTPMTKADGGVGTSSSISGSSNFYAAGGGGASALTVAGEGYVVSYKGSGGSSIGGDGAAPGLRGANASPNTGSGGGGGGYNANSAISLTNGGYGSDGVVLLVATPSATLSTPAAGAILSAPVLLQPKITVPSGAASVTGCSAVDANGSSVGVSVTCSPATSSTSTVALSDLTFTSGTVGQYYTVIFTVNGFDEIRQEMYLGYLPSSVTLASTGATTNFVWDNGTLLATSANQAVTVLATDVTARINASNVVIGASGAISNNTTLTSTTSGNGVIFKSQTYAQATSVILTTANGPVTIWNTNANSPTGTVGVTGVLLNSNSQIVTTGGAITIGGGSDPAQFPLTAEVGVKLNGSAKLTAGGGSVSVQANTVLNSNLNTAADQMVALFMTGGGNQITTTGSGRINIKTVANGSSSGYRAGGVVLAGSSNLIRGADGAISIDSSNAGSGTIIPIQVGGETGDQSNIVETTGNGNVTLVGDGTGTTATSNPSVGKSVFGILIGNVYNAIQTVNGNLSITAKAGSVAASSSTSGIGSIGFAAYAAKVASSGTGSVTINAYGGNVGSVSTNYYQYSIGMDSSSWVGTTSGTLTVNATSGTVMNSLATNTSNAQYGFRGIIGNLLHSTYNDGALLTTTGDIVLNFDTAQAPSGTSSLLSYGAIWNAHRAISNSGNITINASACSLCVGADNASSNYGFVVNNYVAQPSWNQITTGGAGNIIINGRAEHAAALGGSARGVWIISDGPTRNEIVTDTGNISITGAQSGNTTYSAGIQMWNVKTATNSGAVTMAGTTNSGIAGQNYGISLQSSFIAAGSKDVSLTGTANGGPNGEYNVYMYGTGNGISTTTGNITIDGRTANTIDPGGNHYGVTLNSGSITSGNLTTSTTGGVITVSGAVAVGATTTSWYGQLISQTIDTYNNQINLTFGSSAYSSSTNQNVYGLNISGTTSLAATASVLNMTVNSAQILSNGMFFQANAVLNLGGANSHAAININTNNFGHVGTNSMTVNLDTDGDVVLQPIESSFWMDQTNSGSPLTTPMLFNLAPTTRVKNLTIGKVGNARPLSFGKAMVLDSTSGNLKVYSGTLSSSFQVSAPTLAVDSAGGIGLSSTSNAFTNVAVRRASSAGWNLTNSATSWTAGTYSGIVGVYGVPSKLKPVGTPPSTATLGSPLAAYTVTPTDGYDYAIAAANTRSSDAVSVTASIKTGASSALGGTSTQTGTAVSNFAFSDLTFSAAGTHTLAFDATGFTQYVSPNITVSGGTPTVSLSYFSGTNSTTFVSNTTTASPTFSSNNSSSAAYTSLTTSVCTVVSTTGVITTKTPGTCSIKVDQVADSTYLAGTATVNITINKMAQAALTITSTSGSYGAVLTLATSGGNAGAVTYVVDSGTCSLATSTTLNLGAVGDSCMITATRAGDATYASVSSTSTSIATNKGTQAGLVTPSGITISYLSAGLDLSTLTYTGGSGSGAIGFSTATTGCSINGTTLTSTNTVGSPACSISAVKAADASYNTGTPSAFTVAIAKTIQSALSVTSTSATFGQTLSLTYSGGSGTGAITFALVSGSCTVSGTTLTPTAATSCVVKVTKALDTNYNVASSADTTVTIAKGNQAALSITSVSGAYGATLTLTTSGGTDNGSVSYVVDSGTCSLATSTTLTLGNVGDSCMVTATKASTSNYNAVSSASTSIATVKANQATLVAPSGVTLVYADSNGLDLTTVAFTGGSGTGSISFTTPTTGCSIANSILTSTNNAATTCVVASTKAGDSSYNTGTAVNLTVTITKATQAALVISTTTGTYGTALTLNTTGGTETGAVTYVKDSGTCTLAAGVLTLGNAGSSCMVTATKAATTNYNAISSVSTSIITNKANQATLTITSTSGTYNTALTLTTSGGTDNGAVTYVVDSGTCVVSGTSLTLGNAGDTCYVTATKATTTNYNATSSVSTSISTGRAAQVALVAPTGVTLTYGDTTGIDLTTLTFTGGSGTGSLIFSTSTTGCSISSNVITSTNNASTNCVVATNKAGDSNYSAGASVDLTIAINKAAQSALTITTTSATYPTTLSLQTNGGTGGGAVTYSVVSGVCTISSSTLTPTGAGTCVISATKATDTNYTAISSSNTTITIAKGSQSSVSITNSTSISYAGTLTLSASGGSSSATGYVFATSTTGCTITSGILSTTLGATSSCAISAYKAGDSNWNDSNTATATITVIKANQLSTMSVPTGITLSYNNQSGLDLTTLNITGGSGTGAYEFTATTVGCNIANNVLTTANLANTNCLIDVVKAADANYNASPAGTLSVAIVTANQPAITITSTSATYGQTLMVAFTGGIGTGAVTYSATGTCSVDGSGVLTFTAAGATGCSVTVNKAAEANKYNAASSSATTVAVAKGNQTAVSFTSATTIAYAGSLTLTASGGSSTAVGYVFSTSTTNCTVSSATLTSTLPATNSCAISVYKVGDSNWNDSATATSTVTIAKANQAAVGVPTGTSIVYGSGTGVNLSLLTYTGGNGTGSLSFASSTSGCTISTATLTSTNNASTTCTVVVTKAGDANYNASTGVNMTVTINKANQTALTLPTGITLTYADTTGIDLTTLAITGGSGIGSLSFSTATAGCSITSNVLTSTNNANMSCIVSITRASDTNYNISSASSLTVNIVRANQAALTLTSTTATYGQTLTMTTSGGTDNGSVSFVVDSGTCSLNATVLTLGDAGSSCTVTATKAATTNYNAVSSASTSIVTNKANQAALVVPSGVTLAYGSSAGLDLATLSITGGSGSGSLGYTTATSGCSISGSNVLTSTNNAATVCSVSVVKASETNYNASTAATLSVTIAKVNQPALTVTSLAATYPSTLSLTYNGGAGTGALSYAVVSGPCTISSTTLTPTASGSCVITVSRAADTNYNIATSSNATVAIAKGTQSSVSITSTTSMEYLASATLTASGGSSSATGYVFATTTTGCSISGTTLTSTLGATNSCAVTAYKAADSNWDASNTATATVTIIKATPINAATVPSGVTMVYASAGIDLSTLTYSGGLGTGAYTFSTSTTGCTISGSNVLTSTNDAATSCSVSVVKSADANYNASPAGIMSVGITKATQAAISVTSLSATYGANLTLTSSGGTSNGAVTFAKVSGPCTIAAAVLTPTGAGNCVVTATMAGGTNYTDVTSSNYTVVIAKANQAAFSLNLSSTSVAYLGTLALASIGGSGTGSVVYSVTAGSACSINAGNLVAADVGSTCEVLATKVGDSNYNSIDAASQIITTTPIAQAAITFSNASVMTYGQTLTLLAVGGSGSGAITYSVNNAGTTGCTIATNVVSVTASGTCVVSAAKAASNNYLIGSSVNQSITVNKATQTVGITSAVPASPMVATTYTVTATSSSSTPVVFSTVSTGCTVSGSTVTFTATGNCRIDANAAATSQYLAAATVSQTIGVGQRNQTLTFDAATLAVSSKTFGDPAFAIAATSSVNGLTAVYSRGAATTNNACLVSTSGVVTIVAVGVCQIQADQPGDANTAAASAITYNFNVVADVANAPTIVSVSAGHQSITAAFVKPSYTGGAVITGYQLVATHAGGTETFSGCAVVAGNDQSCTISGLTNGTAYTVKVAAINSAGVGLQSAASASRVPATNPAAVTAFTAVPDNTTLKLSWSLPVSLGGGVFDSYRIFIKPSADANYPTTYTTVSSQSIFDYTFTNLINGQAYDAMIVTVTTANTLSLISNTAEVRETPRTVPDAPASILIFEVGSNLVISWTSPVSDGGNAISEYAASIGGAPCVLATPTDTTCSTTTPTIAGDYPIEVKAKNSAGFGEAVTGHFTKAAAPAPPVVIPPSNGGNEFVANPKIPMLVLGLSASKVSTAGGQILTLQTKNMDKLTEVSIDGVKVKILSMSATQVKLLMPKHAPGPVVIKFVSPNGTLDLVAVSYAARITAASAGKVTIKNFIQESATLSSVAKASLKSAIVANPGVTTVTCIGYQSWSYDRPLDAQTALQRAKTACAYLKSLNKNLVVKSVVARTNLIGPASRKLEVVFSGGN